MSLALIVVLPWIVIPLLVAVICYLIYDRRRKANGVEVAMDALPKLEADSVMTVQADPSELEELREQLSSFNQAMAQCPSSIIISDLNGNIQYVNARFCELTGYASDEVVGRNPRLLKSGNMHPGIYAELWDAISSGRVWRGELENRRKDGSVFWELVSISPIKSSEGQLVRYFAVKEDITEAKTKGDEARRAKIEAEAAEAADQAKSVFLKVVSQEMKNPLNRILGFTNLISQSDVNNDQLKHLNQVGRAGLDLLALIDRVLDFTRAETGTMELEASPFKPADVLDRIIKHYKQKAAEKNIVVYTEISETLPDYVIGDEKRFRDVLDPLLDNAVKFTYEGSIYFTLNAEFNDATNVWEFHGKVSDTGQGIPAEALGLLFKPFSQVEPGWGGGPGLGLALCQRLCLLQGGNLTARSELSEGSTFEFDLKLRPMQADAASIQLRHSPDGVQFAKSYPVNILIAEDNRINRRLLETLMERLGYKASFALDGLSVMSQVKTQVFDLILMDLQMPNMGGLEAAQRIRSGEAGTEIKNTRIVAITAFTTSENLEASQTIGMDAFLAKPFDVSKIKMEIIKAYESKMARNNATA